MPKFFYDSVILDQDMLRRLVHRVGADRIMMGSDDPRGEIETDPVGFVSAAELSDKARDKILGRNAMALFGIDLRPYLGWSAAKSGIGRSRLRPKPFVMQHRMR